LYIDQCDTVILRQFVRCDLLYLGVQKLYHGDVFWPCDLAKGPNRRRRFFPSENFTQGSSTGDRIRIRTMLNQYEEISDFGQCFAKLLNPLVVAGPPQLERRCV
jgi:hypothetical protein